MSSYKQGKQKKHKRSKNPSRRAWAFRQTASVLPLLHLHFFTQPSPTPMLQSITLPRGYIRFTKTYNHVSSMPCCLTVIVCRFIVGCECDLINMEFIHNLIQYPDHCLVAPPSIDVGLVHNLIGVAFFWWQLFFLNYFYFLKKIFLI